MSYACMRLAGSKLLPCILHLRGLFSIRFSYFPTCPLHCKLQIPCVGNSEQVKDIHCNGNCDWRGAV
jgi:hypothetical protein